MADDADRANDYVDLSLVTLVRKVLGVYVFPSYLNEVGGTPI